MTEQTYDTLKDWTGRTLEQWLSETYIDDRDKDHARIQVKLCLMRLGFDLLAYPHRDSWADVLRLQISAQQWFSAPKELREQAEAAVQKHTELNYQADKAQNELRDWRKAKELREQARALGHQALLDNIYLLQNPKVENNSLNSLGDDSRTKGSYAQVDQRNRYDKNGNPT